MAIEAIEVIKKEVEKAGSRAVKTVTVRQKCSVTLVNTLSNEDFVSTNKTNSFPVYKFRRTGTLQCIED